VGVGSGRVVHANVNCTDLERSVVFYRDTLGLSPHTRTAPTEPQPGDAFGLDRAQWDAWIMAGPGGFAAPVVDLLEWKVPPPVPADGSTLGYRRLRLVGAVAAAADPDGTALAVTVGPAALTGVEVACSDLARSQRFYDEIVGAPDFFELVAAPPGSGAAPGAANTVGIWRVALDTADLDADVAALGAAGVELVSPPVAMAMGPGLPVLRFVCFRDPDGAVLELIERPAAAATRPT